MKHPRSSSSLLIPNAPLIVLPDLAVAVGVERAIILQQVHYLCSQPKLGRTLADGCRWIWNTYADWKDIYFPFWSLRAIQRHFRLLEADGYLLSEQSNIATGDATKFYRVNLEKIDAFKADSTPDPTPDPTPNSTPDPDLKTDVLPIVPKVEDAILPKVVHGGGIVPKVEDAILPKVVHAIKDTKTSKTKRRKEEEEEEEEDANASAAAASQPHRSAVSPKPTPKTAKLEKRAVKEASSRLSAKRSPERLKTRPELSDEDWLTHLTALPENRGIDVAALFERMVAWCFRNNADPSRRRLLKWLDNDRAAVPIIPRPRTAPFASAAPLHILKERRPPADCPPAQRAAWQAFTDAMRRKLKPDIYRTWFESVLFDGFNEQNDAFRVRASHVIVDWISRYYAEPVYEAFVEIGCAEFTLLWEAETVEFEDIAVA